MDTDCRPRRLLDPQWHHLSMFDTIYLNGDYLPKDQARISPFDRGFLYGDSVYETFCVYNGIVFCLADHILRLQTSLDRLGIELDWGLDTWTQHIQTLLTKNDAHQQQVGLYVQVTRGTYFKRQHLPPSDLTPTVFMLLKPVLKPDPADTAKGFSACTADDIRWHNCDIKTTALIANVMLTQQADDQQAIEAILLRDGWVTEATCSNVFIVKNSTLITPPLSAQLLPGITRTHILKLAAKAGIPTGEQPISETELRQADEILLCSSTREIIPIVELDQQPVGNGKPGPLFQQISQAYQQHVDLMINEAQQ